MPQANLTEAIRPRKFEPTAGWTGLVCWLIIIFLVRVVLHSESPSNPIEHNRFRVDVNQASQAELMALPNLGPATASKIVEYRSRNGPFAEIEQLLRVPGIGPETLRSLRPLLLVGSSEETDDSLATK
jgi:competence ComEA-like helix-hairpin-helix protein